MEIFRKNIVLVLLLVTASLFGATAEKKKLIEDNNITVAVTEISSIQGEGHISPMLGDTVSILGVITGDSDSEGFFVQEISGDGNERTSEAIFIDLPTYDFKNRKDLNPGIISGNTTSKYGRDEAVVGDLVLVSGVVEEKASKSGLTRTQLTDISSAQVISHNNSVEAILLGQGGRAIPSMRISTFVGDLNSIESVNLQDGIGFYESLEGMKVKINNPVVVGSKFGGSYGNLFAVADKGEDATGVNPLGGISINLKSKDYNPEVFNIPMKHYWAGRTMLNMKKGNLYNQKDTLGGMVEGIIYFGLGTYDSLYLFCNLTELKEGRDNSYLYTDKYGRNIDYNKMDLTTLPKAKFQSDKDSLTVASFNVLNMGGDSKYLNQIGADAKIAKMAEAIVNNLGSPDIVGLSELCDNDGDTGNGTAAADKTLAKLIFAIKSLDGTLDYKAVNIDPEIDQDGGKPGVNIRCAFIYNSEKVVFDNTKMAGTTDKPSIKDGKLTHSAVRIGNGVSAFDSSRKSLMALFTVKSTGEEIVVIANHLNSKRGDSSLWGNIQPVVLGSEESRVAKAERINEVIDQLTAYDKVIVLGDMNDFWGSKPMETLIGGTGMENVLDQAGVPDSLRFSYIYNGNSQELDHMISRGFDKVEAENVNMCSPYPTQLSDHDPIVAKFKL